MVSRLPSLNGLRAFEAAARHLSFTLAAEELNVTQTAISHQIRRLEEELGIRLFIRQNRSLALTPQAIEYLPGIHAAFQDLRSATDRLREAETHVATAAPGLQRVLVEALAAGGWFGGSHRAELERIAAITEQRQRAAEIDLLLAEETRISMMVGVAVGWVLAAELGPPNPNPNAPEQES